MGICNHKVCEGFHRAEEIRVIEVLSTTWVGTEELGCQQGSDASPGPGVSNMISSELVDGGGVQLHMEFSRVAKGIEGFGSINSKFHVSSSYREYKFIT